MIELCSPAGGPGLAPETWDTTTMAVTIRTTSIGVY
jgi:hypothetical protein